MMPKSVILIMSEWVLDYSRLLPVGWEATVDQWFQEDAPSFDYGGFVVGTICSTIRNNYFIDPKLIDLHLNPKKLIF
jgi:hypothetical protein